MKNIRENKKEKTPKIFDRNSYFFKLIFNNYYLHIKNKFDVISFLLFNK